MFLTDDGSLYGTLALDWLKNPLAPLLTLFWIKLSIPEVQKGLHSTHLRPIG
jgi:hypothetical protein